MHVLKCPTPAVRALSIRKNQPAFNRFALISLLYIAAYKSVHRPVIWDSAWKAKNGIAGFRINRMDSFYIQETALIPSVSIPAARSTDRACATKPE